MVVGPGSAYSITHGESLLAVAELGQVDGSERSDRNDFATTQSTGVTLAMRAA